MSDAFVYLALQSRSAFDALHVPLLFVGTAVAYMALAFPLGRLADRVGLMRVFLVGYLAARSACTSCCSARGSASAALVLSLGLLGAYYAATDGVLAALASALLPED